METSHALTSWTFSKIMHMFWTPFSLEYTSYKMSAFFQLGCEQMSKHIITAPCWETPPSLLFHFQIPTTFSTYFFTVTPLSEVAFCHLKHQKWNISHAWVMDGWVHADNLEPPCCRTSAQHFWQLCFLGAMSVCPQGWQKERTWIFSQWLQELMPWYKWLALFQMTDPLLA